MEQVILQLLFTNDCVIVPDFGGFVAQRKSAQFDFEKQIISPPSKQILFNKQLIQNDGLLVHEMAKENSLAYYQSSHKIEQTVIDWKRNLKDGKKLTLRELGVFWIDVEGNLQFNQNDTFNVLLDSFGLESIKFISKDASKDDIKVIPISAKKSNVWKYAAAACLLPIAFYSFWIPLKTEALSAGMVSYRDFNPFHKNKKAQYKEVNINLGLIEPNTEDSYYSNLVNARTSPPIIENTISPTAFYCIVGCFSSLENATHLAEQLSQKGYDASVLPGGPLYRVSLGSTFSDEAIQLLKSKATTEGIKTWILH